MKLSFLWNLPQSHNLKSSNTSRRLKNKESSSGLHFCRILCLTYNALLIVKTAIFFLCFQSYKDDHSNLLMLALNLLEYETLPCIYSLPLTPS